MVMFDYHYSNRTGLLLEGLRLSNDGVHSKLQDESLPLLASSALTSLHPAGPPEWAALYAQRGEGARNQSHAGVRVPAEVEAAWALKPGTKARPSYGDDPRELETQYQGAHSLRVLRYSIVTLVSEVFWKRAL